MDVKLLVWPLDLLELTVPMALILLPVLNVSDVQSPGKASTFCSLLEVSLAEPFRAKSPALLSLLLPPTFPGFTVYRPLYNSQRCPNSTH